MNHLLHCCYFLAGLMLCGCSQNTQDLAATIQSAFWGAETTSISPEAVRQLPYASLYVKQEDNPQALMILTWAEPTQSTGTQSTSKSIALKWLSANREMLVTQSGRIIKTVHLRDGNLISVTAEQPDPISLGLQKGQPRISGTIKSVGFGYHLYYQAKSTFIIGDIVNKQLPDGNKSLLHVSERVEIPLLRQHYQNQYWLNPRTGQVIASEQYLFPGSAKVTLSIGKPYVGENNQ
ncbi:YjbF family lipoprotein [Vibrio sp. PP-XX7]